jgi:hypothetical protein
MIYFDHYHSGQIFGIRYRFTEVGDAIPLHKHADELLHNVIVMKGSVGFVTAKGMRHLHAPMIFDFDGTIPHELRCLTDEAEVINVFLNGIPVGYAELPEDQKHGVFVPP